MPVAPTFSRNLAIAECRWWPRGENQDQKSNMRQTQNHPKSGRGKTASRNLHLTHLPAYLAAGAGMAGLATSTEAAIVDIDLTSLGIGTPVDVTPVNGGVSPGTPLQITDWLGTGSGIFGIANQTNAKGIYGTGILGAPYLEFAVIGGDATPKNFSLGDPLNSFTTWSTAIYYAGFKYASSSSLNFTSSPQSYMGFRFGTTGSYNYGWLQVTWDQTDFWILDGAYESTVNGLITAGATASAVPESTASGGLMGLLLGGAALRQWRKSRNKADVAEKALSA